MKINDIEISGIATQKYLNSSNLHYPRREICETFGINFSDDMPKIEIPLQIFFDSELIEIKPIYTQKENKIFIHGIINTKIVYVAETPSNPIKTINFYKHFSCLLAAHNNESDNISAKVFIEDAIITQRSNDSLYVSLLLLVCPIDARNVSEHTKTKFIPKKESINKIEAPKTENLNIPIKNDDADIEIEYDMNMQGQYFESSWK